MRMSLEQLVELGWNSVEMVISELQETGSLWMKYVILANDGTDYIVAADEKLINDPKHKNVMIAKVKARVKEKNAFAVLTLSDAYVSQATNCDRKTLHRIEEMGIPAAVQQGLITSREAILCFIATPIQTIRLIQHYRREGDKQIVLEEREVREGNQHPESGGRLSHFFDHLQPRQT